MAALNYWPGPLVQNPVTATVGTKREICSAWDRLFRCNRSTVRKFADDFDAGIITCENIPEDIRFWPGKGNPFLKQETSFSVDSATTASIDNNLANFFDRDSNGVYNPCKGDYPLWAGTEADNYCSTPENPAENNIRQGADQVIWWVCNDAGGIKNFPENLGLIPEIGMEIHYEAFAYASTDATNDMTFLRQKLYNKGSFTLDRKRTRGLGCGRLGRARIDSLEKL